jgi:NTE family protein
MKKYNKRDGGGFCLVLGGGGAKGVYHLGVWRALKQLKVQVDAFYGNSIGAIVAGYLCQGNEEAMERFCDEAGLDYVIQIPDRLISGGELKITMQNANLFKAFYNRSMKQGGVDTSPLRHRLDRDLSEEAIRKTDKDLGVFAFNLTDLKPCQIYLEEMEPGTVIDYLMASSAVPGFKTPEVGGKQYLDGGVADNIPWKMARDRGWRKIIVVDISGIGVSRRPETEGTVTVHIKNSIDMGGILDFNPDFLKRYRELGYLDTLKTFGVLKGHEYFIEPSPDTHDYLAEVLEDPRFLPCWKEQLPRWETPKDRLAGLREILPAESRYERDLLYPFIDCAASILKLERIHKYSFKELARKLNAVRIAEDRKIGQLKKELAAKDGEKDILVRFSSLVDSYQRLNEEGETPYFTWRVGRKVLGKFLSGSKLKGLLKLYPKLHAGVLFLDILERYYKSGPEGETGEPMLVPGSPER